MLLTRLTGAATAIDALDRRCNRSQSTYSSKEWQTAKAPRQLVSLKFEHDLRNFLCSRGVLRYLNPEP